MLAFILLAQIATASPSPVPATPKSLADLAAERKAGKAGVKGGTLSVAGAPVQGGRLSGAISLPDAAPMTLADQERDEWTARAKAAQDELHAAAKAEAEVANHIPVLIAIPTRRGTRMIENPARAAALAPYAARTSAAQERVNALPEEARKAGAQPGWVR